MPRPASSGPHAGQSGDCQRRLDGLTILRFAHAYETGGGVELYLRDLNRGLSQRSALTTVLVHLTKEGAAIEAQSASLGRGRLFTVPLQVGHTALKKVHQEPNAMRRWLYRTLDLAIFSPRLNRLFARSALRWRTAPRRLGEALLAGPTTANLIRRHQVDLVVLHTNGGADASEVIAAARDAEIPIALIHHFSNHKLGHLSARQQVARVGAVAGASGIGLPRYVRSEFTNLSDAVDLEFFQSDKVTPASVRLTTPVLFAPGRLTAEKGQLDALKVAIELQRRGFKIKIVFAGRVDDVAFERSLQELVRGSGHSDLVHFAGELTLPQYRDWFNSAYLTLIPTHHFEGMPRTLIDSQAMRVPPIVYEIGGTREGVRHKHTGFLVQIGDISGMTDHAAFLLENPEHRNAMAENGRKFVESEFSMDAFLMRHEEFYLEAIARGPKKKTDRTSFR